MNQKSRIAKLQSRHPNFRLMVAKVNLDKTWNTTCWFASAWLDKQQNVFDRGEIYGWSEVSRKDCIDAALTMAESISEGRN